LSNTSFHLFQLQKIDQSTAQLEKRLSIIQKKLLDTSFIVASEKELQTANDSLAQTQTQYLELENSISKKKIKLAQSDSSLYGGLVKNPKELQDLQFEISSLKKNILALEDLQLEKLVDLESKELITQDLQSHFKQLLDQHSIEEAQFESEVNQIKIELNRLNNERNATESQIPSIHLLSYSSLKNHKNGIAVGVIEDGCCLSCGNMLTPAECQTAKSPNKIITCPSCGRILYAG
jgi:predicted  nucleic acid-binding Zn-ribbon protein